MVYLGSRWQILPEYHPAGGQHHNPSATAGFSVYQRGQVLLEVAPTPLQYLEKPSTLIAPWLCSASSDVWLLQQLEESHTCSIPIIGGAECHVAEQCGQEQQTRGVPPGAPPPRNASAETLL